MGLPDAGPAALETAERRERFLAALAGRLKAGEAFMPASVGFVSAPGEIRERENARQARRLVTYIGACSREALLGGLEAVATQVRDGGAIDVRFKQWDALSEWPPGKELVI